MTRLDEVFDPLPERLTVDQLAQVLGIRPFTAYKYLQQGAVPAYKVGGSWVIYRDEVRDHMLSERAERESGRLTATGPDDDQPDTTEPPTGS